MAIGDHPKRIWDLIGEVRAIVKKTKTHTGWRADKILKALDVAPSTYYRVLRLKGLNIPSRKRNVFSILPEEKEAIIEYALKNINPRHRELAWKMVDEGVVCVSPSTVYRVLDGASLVPKWPVEITDEQQGSGPRKQRGTLPDEVWEVDITYIKVDDKWWFLLIFIDEYSRYIVYWELRWSMDAPTVSLAAETALSIEGRERAPIIQTDNGPAFISREFKRYLSHVGIGHKRIHPYTPTENAIVERGIRTVKELAGASFPDDTEARVTIKGTIDYYNNERLHSSLHYLRPIDYYRGNPLELLEVRREKLASARERRKQMNLGLRQTTRYPEEVSS